MNKENIDSIKDLIKVTSAVMDKLNLRGVLHSRNNPIVEDLSKYLISRSLDLKLKRYNSKVDYVGYNAIDKQGVRYQIQGKVIDLTLGIIRNLDENQFDFLIGVIFDHQYEIIHAVKIPHSLIKEYSKFNGHQNGYFLTLWRTIREDKRVENIITKVNYE